MSGADVHFADRVGQEMFQLLLGRMKELGSPQDFDSYSAALGAALIPVAEVLRDPIQKGADPEQMVTFASLWLHKLLDQIKREHSA